MAEKEGTVVLQSVPGATEISSIYSRNPARIAGQEVVEDEVPCVSVDGYLREHGIARVAFLRIDTEGADVDVLTGARHSLAGGCIDVLQFEYNSAWIDARHFLRDAFDLLLPLGYHVGKLRADRVEQFTSWDYRLEWFEQSNYVAWKSSLKPAFRVDVTERYLTT